MSKRTIDNVDFATIYGAKRVEIEPECDDAQSEHTPTLPLPAPSPLHLAPATTIVTTATATATATVPAPPAAATPAAAPMPLPPFTTELLHLPDDCLSLITSQLPARDRLSLRVTNRALHAFTDVVYTREMLKWFEQHGWWVPMDIFLQHAAKVDNKAAMRFARKQGATDFKEALKAAAGSGAHGAVSLLLKWISEPPRVYTIGTARLYEKIGTSAIKAALRGNFNDCADAIYYWIQQDWSSWYDANRKSHDLCMFIVYRQIDLLEECVLSLDTPGCNMVTFNQVYWHWYHVIPQQKFDVIAKVLHQDLANTMMLVAAKHGQSIFIYYAGIYGANNFEEADRVCADNTHSKQEIQKWMAENKKE